MKDMRPEEYRYWKQLMDHLGGSPKAIIEREFRWPRQFEIHLPANHKQACNLGCAHCAGSTFDKTLGRWETTGLTLLDRLQGKIPFHIYGGAYTEPLMNPYYMAYLAMTKKHGNHFGMHVNGTLLKWMEENQGFLTELNALSTDRTDYLSISIDAGTPWTWGLTKGSTKRSYWYDIIEATRMAVKARRARENKGHAIRWCYLISPHSGTPEDFGTIVSLAKSLGVDSLRFSIPFDNYNKSFDVVRLYKQKVEQPKNLEYFKMLEPYLSASEDERPYIFYTGPQFTDIDRYTFKRCAYGYYQITYGADGYVYRCSTTATPTAKQCRLGKITDDVADLVKMIATNQAGIWNCQEHCFQNDLRGNRMALEINSAVEALENV